MKKKAFQQFRCLSLVGALAAFAMAAPAGAGVFDSPAGLQVSREIVAPEPMKAGGSSAITAVSGRGTGAIDFAHSKAGACPSSPVPCDASGGHCECDIFNGSVTLPKLGKGSLNLNITSNDDDSFPNGSGSCFPGTGQGTICNGGTCVGLQVQGLLCIAVLNETNSSNGNVIIDANEVFYIDPSTSTGKAAGASGGGALEISNLVAIVNGNVASSTGYTTINGAYQSKP